MATAMMRVRADIDALLQRLADEDGVSMQDVLWRALEQYRCARLFEHADEAYAPCRAIRTHGNRSLTNGGALHAWYQVADGNAADRPEGTRPTSPPCGGTCSWISP